MGKRGSQLKGRNGGNLGNNSMTLREESLGKKQTNVSAKSMLKVQHLKNLAKWASVEASVPSLGAFFGHRLADCMEGLGIPADPALFTCERFVHVSCFVLLFSYRNSCKRFLCIPSLRGNCVKRTSTLVGISLLVLFTTCWF